jgi:hypothetical protein
MFDALRLANGGLGQVRRIGSIAFFKGKCRAEFPGKRTGLKPVPFQLTLGWVGPAGPDWPGGAIVKCSRVFDRREAGR